MPPNRTKWFDLSELNAITFKALPPGTPTFTIDRELWLPYAPAEVFKFFANPAHLARLTPPELRLRMVSPQPVELKADALIDYRLRVRGLPLRWRTRISLWDPPVRFADEQVRGPYRMWIHLHTFEPEADGTRVCDRVIYAVYGGKLVNRLFAAKDVERIFDYRRDRLRRLFNAQ